VKLKTKVEVAATVFIRVRDGVGEARQIISSEENLYCQNLSDVLQVLHQAISDVERCLED
jgi:hypothetical protein